MGMLSFVDMDELILEYIPKYCFYWDEDGERYFCCSHCGEVFSVDKRIDYDIYSGYVGLGKVKHWETGNCPCCDYPVTFLARGRFTTFESLSLTKRVVFVDECDENHVRLLAYYVNVNFETNGWHYVYPFFTRDLRAIYDLRPGDVHVYFNEEHFTDSDSRMKEVAIREPFNGYMYNPGTYDILNVEDLGQTFLRYLDLNVFSHYCGPRRRNGGAPYVTRLCSFLCYASLYPQIEFLMKNDAYSYVSDVVYHKDFNRRYLDWSQRSMKKFFKMTKNELALFERTGFSEFVLSLWYDGNRTLDFLTFAKYVDAVGKNNAVALFDMHREYGFSLSDMTEYARQGKDPGERFVIWRDYVRAARLLGYDLSCHSVLYPVDLIAEHDNALSMSCFSFNGELSQQQKKLLEDLRYKFEYESETFFIHVPCSPEEFVAESRMQRNCVKGYGDRHFSGITTILFLREKRCPHRSFYTIEVRDGVLTQCYGYHNDIERGCSTEAWDAYMLRDRRGALAFKDEWWAWVLAGSPHDSNGNVQKLKDKKKREKPA